MSWIPRHAPSIIKVRPISKKKSKWSPSLIGTSQLMHTSPSGLSCTHLPRMVSCWAPSASTCLITPSQILTRRNCYSSLPSQRSRLKVISKLRLRHRIKTLHLLHLKAARMPLRYAREAIRSSKCLRIKWTTRQWKTTSNNKKTRRSVTKSRISESITRKYS